MSFEYLHPWLGPGVLSQPLGFANIRCDWVQYCCLRNWLPNFEAATDGSVAAAIPHYSKREHFFDWRATSGHFVEPAKLQLDSLGTPH